MKNANGVIKKLTSAERSYYTAAEVRERKHMVSVSTGLHIEHRLRELCARLTEQPEQKLTRR